MQVVYEFRKRIGNFSGVKKPWRGTVDKSWDVYRLVLQSHYFERGERDRTQSSKD